MKKPQTHSLAYISIFLVIISVIVYLNVVFQANLKADITKQFNRQQLLLARGAALSIEKQVDHYMKHLVTISQLSSLLFMQKNSQNGKIISTLLGDMPKEDLNVVNFQIVDSRGIIKFNRSSPALVGMDVADRVYFTKTRELPKGEVYISELMKLHEMNPDKRYVVISTPMFNAGKYAGAALFAISVDDIAGEFVSQIRMGDKGYAWVMDSQGKLVYHPEHPEMIGRRVTKAAKSCYKCHRSFDAENKILEGRMEYGVYTAPMGEDKLISYSRARVGSESWLVCVTMPYSEVTGLIAKSMQLYSWLISLIFITVIGTSVFFIVLVEKKTAADERAKYAAELEDRIQERTSELTSEKEKLHAILSGFGAGVSLIDDQYNVQWANEVITSKSLNPVGRKCYAAFRNRITPCPECVMGAVFQNGEIAQTEIVCRKQGARPDVAWDETRGDLLATLTQESVGNFQIIIAPIKDPDGHVRQAVELIQDISAMRRLEQQMMHSEKLAALGRISAGIAHEIGNPLTAIYSYVQILQGNVYDEFTNNTLDTVAFHLNRIREILQQMSGFSRSYTMEKAPVDLNEAAKAAFDLIGGHGDSMKGIHLESSYCPEKLMVMADEKWLVSVFVNLALNALDAMPENGTLSVRTYLEKHKTTGDKCVVDVTDTGIGIAPENLNRIFDPFYTTKQTGKGTGLGLAVSYNIIKDLKGEISVESQVGEGTTFRVRLPLINGET
jgi:two-component system, NtrC family, sensor kinase